MPGFHRLRVLFHTLWRFPRWLCSGPPPLAARVIKIATRYPLPLRVDRIGFLHRNCRSLPLFFRLNPHGQEIGEEVHDDRDQFFRIEAGEGEIWIDGVRHAVKADDGVIVPQGARHNVVSTGSEPLRLYTLYGPPEHRDGTVHATVEEASADHEHFDGRTTE